MPNEESLAQQAVLEEDTIVGQILRKEVTCKFPHEDDKCVAFHDINPQAPVQFLVILRKPITKLSDVKTEDSEILGLMMVTAAKIANNLGLNGKGYRLVTNNGTHGCQSVYYLHMHVLGALPAEPQS